MYPRKVAKRLQIKQKATETKSHILVRNHKTEFLEHTYSEEFFLLSAKNAEGMKEHMNIKQVLPSSLQQ